jgi:hypothetical protein
MDKIERPDVPANGKIIRVSRDVYLRLEARVRNFKETPSHIIEDLLNFYDTHADKDIGDLRSRSIDPGQWSSPEEGT